MPKKLVQVISSDPVAGPLIAGRLGDLGYAVRLFESSERCSPSHPPDVLLWQPASWPPSTQEPPPSPPQGQSFPILVLAPEGADVAAVAALVRDHPQIAGWIFLPASQAALFAQVETASKKSDTPSPAFLAPQESRRKLQNLIGKLSTAVVVHGPHSEIVFMNKAAADFLGLAAPTALGLTAEDSRWTFLHEDRRPARPEDYPVNIVLRTGKPLMHQILGVPRDAGRISWGLIDAFPELDAHGAILHVIVTFMDVTPQKTLEESLFSEKERLFVTLKNIGEGVVAVDPSGMISLFNDTAESLTGWSQEEVLGRDICEVLPIDEAVSTCKWVDVYLEKSIFTPLSVRKKNGEAVLLEVRGAPLRQSEGELLGGVVVFRDVTQREQTEERLRQAEKLESIGLLASGIAHDFNNLLTGIFGYVQLAQLFLDTREQAESYLQSALEPLNRAKELTQQLLTFSKGGHPVKKTASIEPLLRSLAGLSLTGSNVSARFSLASNLWPCEMNESQIGQVLEHLILNAVQAMPFGGELTIAAANHVQDDKGTLPLKKGAYVRISISDQGVGIPQEHLHKIFEPFFTTKSTGKGIGLSICYSIVKKHAGLIDVATERNKGSTFTVYLPASSEPNPSPADAPGAAPFKTAGRVLLLDDEEAVRVSTRIMLEQMGLTVDAVSQGEEAIGLYEAAQARNAAYLAVILDLKVKGGMGGLETLSYLRKHYPSVKAVAVSGYSNDNILAHPTQYGFSAALSKPFTMPELAGLMRGLLRIETPR